MVLTFKLLAVVRLASIMANLRAPWRVVPVSIGNAPIVDDPSSDEP
jgi:hypothetical protein